MRGDIKWTNLSRRQIAERMGALAWMPTEGKLVNTTTRLDPVIPHACVSF